MTCVLCLEPGFELLPCCLRPVCLLCLNDGCFCSGPPPSLEGPLPEERVPLADIALIEDQVTQHIIKVTEALASAIFFKLETKALYLILDEYQDIRSTLKSLTANVARLSDNLILSHITRLRHQVSSGPVLNTPRDSPLPTLTYPSEVVDPPVYCSTWLIKYIAHIIDRSDTLVWVYRDEILSAYATTETPLFTYPSKRPLSVLLYNNRLYRLFADEIIVTETDVNIVIWRYPLEISGQLLAMPEFNVMAVIQNGRDYLTTCLILANDGHYNRIVYFQLDTGQLLFDITNREPRGIVKEWRYINQLKLLAVIVGPGYDHDAIITYYDQRLNPVGTQVISRLDVNTVEF